MTVPHRITPDLCAILQKDISICMMNHFNHPKECTPKNQKSLLKLVQAGCFLAYQAVLLKVIHDNTETLQTLHKWLCRTDRLFRCDHTQGFGHCTVPISKDFEIMKFSIVYIFI